LILASFCQNGLYVTMSEVCSSQIATTASDLTWPYFAPAIIAHDVGRSRDRSTAVVGGNSGDI
jgi:hypothetical protein